MKEVNMKTLRITKKILTVLLLAGVLFLSCELAEPDAYGTLVITLPGSEPARAVSANDPDFLAYITTLSYRIECNNGADTKSKTVRYSKTVPITLSPGEWTVTIVVLDQNKEGENKEIGRSNSVRVNIEAGETTTVPKITISIEYQGEEKPIDWPSTQTWRDYDLTAGLRQPAGTTVAYVFTDGETLSNGADEDLKNLPNAMQPQPPEGKKFLLVKLELKDTAFDANTVVYIVEQNGLWYQIRNNDFLQPSKLNVDYYFGGNSSKERWDIFKKSDAIVNLYMSYDKDYIIILAVKNYAWEEIRWADYRLDDLIPPERTKVLHVSYDPEEGNKTKNQSMLQRDYGMRVFNHKGFPEFLAVVFLDEDGEIYEDLKTQIALLYPNPTVPKDSNDKEIPNALTFTARQQGKSVDVIDLYIPEKPHDNYTIITVRKGDNWY